MEGKEIYFMRHGETSWNKIGKPQGQEADISMNKKGKNQVRKTALYLRTYREKYSHFDCIYASPMLRTRQTVDIIKNILDYKGDILYEDLLKEKKLGKLSGVFKTDQYYVDIQQFKNAISPIDPIERILFRDTLTDLTNINFDTGVETGAQLEDRIKPFIETLKNSPHKKILVVGHHTTLYTILKCMFNIGHVPESNGGNCWISYITYNPVNNFKLISAPNTQHLYINNNYLM